METTASHFPGYFTSDSRNTYNDGLTELAAKGAMDNGYRTAKSEAGILAAVMSGHQKLESSIGEGFCDTQKSIGDVKCEIGRAECEILKNSMDIAHRNSIALNALERGLSKEINDKHDRVKDQLYSFERQTAENFCKVEMNIKDSERRVVDILRADKLDDKQEIIDSLRHERSNDRFHHAFALQNQELSSLKQMINSVEQTQRFSSKTVTFGSGNFIPTTQTANQG